MTNSPSYTPRKKMYIYKKKIHPPIYQCTKSQNINATCGSTEFVDSFMVSLMNYIDVDDEREHCYTSIVGFTRRKMKLLT